MAKPGAVGARSVTPGTRRRYAAAVSGTGPGPAVLRPVDVARLLAATPRGPAGWRLAAIVGVVHGTGRRMSHVLGLRLGDIESPSPALAAWLGARAAAGVPGDLVFCRFDGGRLDASYVRHALARLALRAGVDGPVSAEALRRAGASAVIAGGGGDDELQRFLGHRRRAGAAQYRRRLEARGGVPDRRPSPVDGAALLAAVRDQRLRAQELVARARRLDRVSRGASVPGPRADGAA